MHITNLRKVGGSVMLAVPPALLDILKLKAGANVGIALEGSRLVIEPTKRPHYRMEQLLADSDYTTAPTDMERDWIDAPARGQELL